MLAAVVAVASGPRALADDERGAKHQTSGAAQPGSAAEGGTGAQQDTPTPITGSATTESGKAGHLAVDKGNTEVIRGLYAQNALDLETASLAKKRSQDEQVKQLADSVERDHKRLGEKLEELASGRGVKLSRAQALEGGRKAHLEDMKNMSASEFDRHFSEMMAADHEKLLKQVGTALDQASASGDRELAAVLQEFKPVFQQHQQSAAALSGKTERGSLGSGAEASDAPARDQPAQAEPGGQPKTEGEGKGY
jgi:putative membrane protein